MTKRACLDETVGKTIDRFARGLEHLAIYFTDDTVCVVSAVTECEAWDLEITDDATLEVDEQSRLGLITTEEYQEWRSQKEKEQEERREKDERRALAFLKAKYEQS